MTGWHFSIVEKRSLFYIHFSLSCDCHANLKCGKKKQKQKKTKFESKVRTRLNGAFIWETQQLETSTLMILYAVAGSFVTCVGWIRISVSRVAARALTQGDQQLWFCWTADVAALLAVSERGLRLCRPNRFSHQMTKMPSGSSSGCRII